MNRNDVVIYKDGDLEVVVQINSEEDTVQLTLNQIAELFERDKLSIYRHISNIYKNSELDRSSTVAKNATVQNEGAREATRMEEHYNLDMIISAGYRVKSKQGVAFRRWASPILKDYMLKGYAVNEKELKSLNRTVEIRPRIVIFALEFEREDGFKVVTEYTRTHIFLMITIIKACPVLEGNDNLYRFN